MLVDQPRIKPVLDDLLPVLHSAYRTPSRAYHSWDHVEEVLRGYEEVAAGPGWDHPAEVRLACLFHDAVHVAGNDDNEERSAQLATELLRDRPVDTGRVADL